MPKFCPSCGAEGSLVAEGNLYRCTSEGCGRAFLIDPKKPPDFGSEDKSTDKSE